MKAQHPVTLNGWRRELWFANLHTFARLRGELPDFVNWITWSKLDV